MNICNIINFAISLLTNNYIAAKPFLAPYLDDYRANSNLNILFTKFKALSRIMLNTLLGYNCTLIIISKLLLQNVLNIIKSRILFKNNNYFLYTQVTGFNETINSKTFFKTKININMLNLHI